MIALVDVPPRRATARRFFLSGRRFFAPLGLALAWTFWSSAAVAGEGSPPRASNQEDGQEQLDREQEELDTRIREGSASFVDVRQALSNPDVGRLVNVMHSMYSMRWRRLSLKLLLGLWRREEPLRDSYPELAWEALDKTPVRLALASTLLRAQAPNPGQYLSYLLRHKYDKHEFHRAQVVIALGLNGNPDDVEYLAEMVGDDSHYVVQAAVTGLGLMRDAKAKRELGILWKEYRDTPKGELVEQVLLHVYRVAPKVQGEKEPPVSELQEGAPP